MSTASIVILSLLGGVALAVIGGFIGAYLFLVYALVRAFGR